jgi:NAD(P)-dependent dehydrogenase (short-subunit alcohol dehydrogenase family)
VTDPGRSQLPVRVLWKLRAYTAANSALGGGTGIGLMTSVALAANGARVYIGGRRKEVLENAIKSHNEEAKKASGGELIALPFDETDKASIQEAVKEVSKREKYINLLVNNAGIVGPKADIQVEGAKALSEALFSQVKAKKGGGGRQLADGSSDRISTSGNKFSRRT